MGKPPDRSFPTLPAGYEAQPVSSFHDANGGAFEFHHVYGRPQATARRGPVRVMDEDLSFWSVSRPSGQSAGSLSYEEARKRGGPHLTFRRFSSRTGMEAELGALLAAGGRDPEVKGSA